MKEYGYNREASHGWAIFEKGTEADPNIESKWNGVPEESGGVIGTSEWIWLDKDWARRIVAALNYFDNIPTVEIEKMEPAEIKKTGQEKNESKWTLSKDI